MIGHTRLLGCGPPVEAGGLGKTPVNMDFPDIWRLIQGTLHGGGKLVDGFRVEEADRISTDFRKAGPVRAKNPGPAGKGLGNRQAKALEEGRENHALCRGVPEGHFRLLNETRHVNPTGAAGFPDTLVDDFRPVPIGSSKDQFCIRMTGLEEPLECLDKTQVILAGVFQPGDVKKDLPTQALAGPEGPGGLRGLGAVAVMVDPVPDNTNPVG